MKNLSLAFVILTIVVLLVTSVKAESFSEEKSSKIVENLSAGLSSENAGLRTSSALVLSNLIDGNYMKAREAGKTVISLMKMLNKGVNDEEKISAALALYKIGDAKGIYKLAGSAKFDESSRVKKICFKLYSEYHRTHGTEYLMSY